MSVATFKCSSKLPDRKASLSMWGPGKVTGHSGGPQLISNMGFTTPSFEGNFFKKRERERESERKIFQQSILLGTLG